MSIGPSSHKNEYRAGVRIGNWVEELHGKEAPTEPAMQIPPAPQSPTRPYQPMYGEGKQCETADILFSHGQTFGQSYQATMNGLHFQPPMERDTADRVQRTFYWGSKLRDAGCPATNPNAPTTMLDAKREQWASEQKPSSPIVSNHYITSNTVAYG